MSTYILPEALIPAHSALDLDLFLCNYSSDYQSINNKNRFTKNVFSFVLEGQKKVSFREIDVLLQPDEFICIASGNCLMSENLSGNQRYEALLLFFSNDKITDFLAKYKPVFSPCDAPITCHFRFQKDAYLTQIVASLVLLLKAKSQVTEALLQLKLEEILLHLSERYGHKFLDFLAQQIQPETADFSFKRTVERNVYNNLKLEEIAFLCNMSLSTFKRRFAAVYGQTPSRWLQTKRLQRAKELLKQGHLRPTEIFSDFGYENLSSFTFAFKRQFGMTPREV